MRDFFDLYGYFLLYAITYNIPLLFQKISLYSIRRTRLASNFISIVVSMTDCYSVVNGGKDIVTESNQEIIKKKLCVCLPKEIEKKLVHKIYWALLLYKEQWFKPFPPYVTTLSWSCLELRIQLPWSKYLLRIIAEQHKDTIIIFSGYIIKPEHYEDKQTVIITKKMYTEEIKRSWLTKTDFFWPQEKDYVKLYEI